MKFNHSYLVLITVLSALVYYVSNIKRTEAGYFTDPFWITVNSSVYIIFFSVMTGFVVAKVLKIKR